MTPDGAEVLKQLAPRELAVLVELCKGGTNQQIGKRLGISARTVGNYITAIAAATGTTSKLKLLLFAHKHQVLKEARMLAKIKEWLKGLGADEPNEFVRELTKYGHQDRVYHLKSLADRAGKR